MGEAVMNAAEALPPAQARDDVAEEPIVPYDYREDFWLAKPAFSSEFASEVFERFTRHAERWDTNTPIAEAVWTAYRMYHGLANNISTPGGLASSPVVSLTEAGESGEFLSLFVNQYRGLLRHQLALVTAERPVWEPQAKTADSDSAKQVTLTRNLLDHLMDVKGFTQKLYSQQELMGVLGVAFQALGWDARLGRSGSVWSVVLAPWEVAHEHVREYTDCQWWIFRRMESRWDWIAHFAATDPDKARSLKALSPDNKLLSGVQDMDPGDVADADRIPVLYLYANPTRACPDGRVAIIAGEDLVLQDGPMPYGEDSPITRVCAAEFLGTSVPYANSWSQLPICDALTGVISTIVTRLDLFGIPDVVAPEGTEFERGTMGGANLIRNTAGLEKASALDLLNIPSALPNIAAMFKGYMEELSGINSVTRGNPNENITSGSMAALVQAQAVQFNSAEERTYTLNLEAIGTHLLRIYQRMATEEQLINIAGQDESYTIKSFKGENLGQVQRVAVKRVSAFMKSIIGRKEAADKLLERNLIPDPRQYYKAIETGNPSAIYKGPVDQLNLIKSENERMARGEPVVVTIFENHPLHIREHMDELNNDGRYDPARRQRLEAHLYETYELYAKLSREAPSMLEAMGIPPLSQEYAIGQQAMAMMGGGQASQPSQSAPQSPGAAEQKSKPGPAPSPPGREPSQAGPSLPNFPKPATRSGS